MTNQKYFDRLAILGLIFLIALAVGCSMKWKQAKCRQWGVCETTKDSTYQHDSTYYVPTPVQVDPDSAYVTAYFECDSTNRVILRQLIQANGKYLILQKELESGKYTVTAYLPGRTDTVFAKGQSRVIVRYKVVKEITNVLKKSDQFKVNAFWPMLIIIVVMLAGIVIYVYRKITK